MFMTERTQFEAELEEYYAALPTPMTALEEALHAESAAHPAWLPAERKAFGYAQIAERCPVKIFRHFPFYFEIDVGKPRTNLGEGGVGGWLKREPFGRQLEADANAWWEAPQRQGLCIAWPVLDDNHHCIGNDNVFANGLNGFIRRAEARLATASTPDERAFLEGVIAGNRALIAIANRFADEAERLLASEADWEIRARLRRIAETARHSPAEPPATFYEALNTLLFMREVTQALEGNGNSVLGHFDRILWPYYERDLAAGRITRAEAKDLLAFMLALSDTRFGMHRMGEHYGTNTTVVIGGCDAQGHVIFNELTRMIVELYRELRNVDPKLNARISGAHPQEYFALLAALTADGCNSLAIFNDEVIIPANVKMGKTPEDCRLYVGGGCQENLLENTEVNSRATIYLNLAQIFLMGFFPADYAYFTEQESIAVADYAGCTTFEELYAAFLGNLHAVNDAFIDQRNRTEREGWRYHPCPTHSATLSDCLDNARDMMSGGARYNSGSVALVGAGTIVDSLYAVQQAVFTQQKLTLAQLAQVLATNFTEDDATRHYLLRRIAKFGAEDAGIRAFSARVFADLARATAGKANTRGGVYEASLFSFRCFTGCGAATGATPDGRKAGEYLSPGMSPSLQALGGACSVGQVLSSLEPLELTDYPVVAVLDLKLPASPTGLPPGVITPVICRFLDAGGSVLQMNCVNPATLLDAKAHPERHQDLVVRISGYSAYFTTLPAQVQDEIIGRTAVTA